VPLSAALLSLDELLECSRSTIGARASGRAGPFRYVSPVWAAPSLLLNLRGTGPPDPTLGITEGLAAARLLARRLVCLAEGAGWPDAGG